MAVAYKSSNIFPITSTNNVFITKPTDLAVGDLLIAHIFNAKAQTITPPSGFTALLTTTTTGSINQHAMYLFWKVADAGDVAATTFSFTTASSQTAGGGLMAFTGATSFAPIPEFAGSTANNTGSPSFANTITPHIADSMILILGGLITAGSTSGVSTYAIATSNPSWTEIYDDSPDTARRFYAAYGSRPQTTATGNSSVVGAGTYTTSDWVGQMLAIMPLQLQTITDTVTCTDSQNYLIANIFTDTLNITDLVTTLKQRVWKTLQKNVSTWLNQDKS